MEAKLHPTRLREEIMLLFRKPREAWTKWANIALSFVTCLRWPCHICNLEKHRLWHILSLESRVEIYIFLRRKVLRFEKQIAEELNSERKSKCVWLRCRTEWTDLIYFISTVWPTGVHVETVAVCNGLTYLLLIQVASEILVLEWEVKSTSGNFCFCFVRVI